MLVLLSASVERFFVSRMRDFKFFVIFNFFLHISRNLFKFELVLISASVERVGVSRMRDFYIGIYTIWHKIFVAAAPRTSPLIDWPGPIQWKFKSTWSALKCEGYLRNKTCHLYLRHHQHHCLLPGSNLGQFYWRSWIPHIVGIHLILICKILLRWNALTCTWSLMEYFLCVKYTPPIFGIESQSMFFFFFKW